METVNKALLAKIWKDCLPKIEKALGSTTFETWILPLAIQQQRSQKEQKLFLESPDPFFKDWVLKNYLHIIKQALRSSVETEGGKLEVEIVVRSSSSPSAPTKPAAKSQTPSSQTPDQTCSVPSSVKRYDGLVLNPRFTFEDFTVGPCNRFAHAAAMAIAESPARAYNPFFIYGGVGLGKTHLMQSICHAARKRDSSVKICYIPSEQFTNELINAIRHRSTAAFRQKYRNMNILVVDDIHFIAGKESTQEEFFHTFNALYDAHKQIIISSDRPPREIPKLEERLISRFSWGLITDVQPPDFETRVAILKNKLEKEPVNIPDEVIFFIAQIIKTNVRELEGALIRITARSQLAGETITLDTAKEVLKDCVEQVKKPLDFQKIQQCVADEFGVTLADLKTKKRNKNLVLPRQVAMYLCRQLTEASLPEIAKSFGGRDHTTILYAYNKIRVDLERNGDSKSRINQIIKKLKH